MILNMIVPLLIAASGFLGGVGLGGGGGGGGAGVRGRKWTRISAPESVINNTECPSHYEWQNCSVNT